MRIQGEPGEREDDLEPAPCGPRGEAETRAEGRGEDRMVEDGRPEEVAPADEEVDTGRKPLRLCAVEEEDEVLGQREPEPDRGAVDEPVVESFEDG